MRLQIGALFLSSLAMLVQVQTVQAVIDPSTATFDYEGSSLPGFGSFPNGFPYRVTSSSGTATVAESIANGIYTLDLKDAGTANGGAGSSSQVSYGTIGASSDVFPTDTFTLDARVDRGLISYGANASGTFPNLPYLDIFAGSLFNNPGRVIVILGAQNSAANNDLTIYDNSGFHEVDNIPGLNVDTFNNFRVVGTGGGAYSIYLNSITTPIVSGTFVSAANDGRDGSFLFGNQLQATGNQLSEIALQINYIRVDSTQALTAPPLATGIPGDINGDGQVNLTDFGILTSHFSQSVAAGLNGDLNGDGKVNISDFSIFKQDYSAFNGGMGLSAAVPEPGTLALLVAALPVWLLVRARKSAVAASNSVS